MLQGIGYEALATTSAGFANTLGRLDGEVTLDEKLAHCRLICDVTTIPVNVDFENGFADAPKAVAENVERLIPTGVVGASIEDWGNGKIYDFEHAVERVHAASEVAHRQDFPFLLTARCENLLRGVQDMDDTLRRLLAYSAAGADVLYAPGLRTLEQVQTVLDAVDKPLNVLGAMMPAVTVAEYAQVGVRRISLGGGLHRHAMSAGAHAAEQLLETGSLGVVSQRLSAKEPVAYFKV